MTRTATILLSILMLGAVACAGRTEDGPTGADADGDGDGDGIEVLFANYELDAGVVKALMADPTSLTFEVSRYGLTRPDPAGDSVIDYAALAEYTTRQTGLVVVDYGDGRVERHAVATNLRRGEDGRSEGATMREVLELLGLADGYATDAEGRVVRFGGLERVSDPVDPRNDGFWAVLSDEPEERFEDMVLRPGRRVTLAYMKDSDGDLLFDRIELLEGTDPFAYDTDGDGLCDGPRPVYDCVGAENLLPPPTRVVDEQRTERVRVGEELVPDGLLALWPMHESVDGATLHEATGHGSALGVVGPAVWSIDRHGRVGAIQAGSAHVEGAALPTGDIVTVSFWIRPDATHGTIFEGPSGIRVHLSGGRIGVQQRLANGSDVEMGTTGTLPAGEWSHVTVSTHAGPEVLIHIRVNGETWKFDRVFAWTWGIAYGFASSSTTSAGHLQAALDDIRVYDRLLTDDEARALFEEAAPRE